MNTNFAATRTLSLAMRRQEIDANDDSRIESLKTKVACPDFSALVVFLDLEDVDFKDVSKQSPGVLCPNSDLYCP